MKISINKKDLRQNLLKVVSQSTEEEFAKALVEAGDDTIKFPFFLEMIDGLGLKIGVNELVDFMQKKFGDNWYEDIIKPYCESLKEMLL